MFNFSIMPLDPLHIDEICEDIKNQYRDPERYTIKETLLIMGGAVGSGLLIASIFIGAMFLFLLFATQVWMK